MGKPEEARKSYAKLAAVARNDGEKLQAHFWTAMSYVHEGATDKALAEDREDGRHRPGGRRTSSPCPATRTRWATSCSRPAASTRRPSAYQEQVATIDKADAPAQVKEATRRQALFDEARVALARNDVAAAKAKAAAYAKAVAAQARSRSRCARPTSSRAASRSRRRTARSRWPSWPRPTSRTRASSTSWPSRHEAAGDAAKAKQAGVQAADFNGLSPNYGYVRGKAKAMVSGPKKN